MERRAIHLGESNGLYSSGLLVGNVLYTSGYTAVMDDGTIPSDIESQTRVVLDKLQKVLAQVGATLTDVVKVNVFLTHMGDYAGMNKVYATYFSDPLPARACVQVAGLTDPRKRLEIEMVAVLGERRQ